MTGNKLEISDLAIEQIQELVDFHEKTRKGKGSDFLETLWDCLESLENHPKRWQYHKTAEEKIRRAISNYPQSIILYSFEEETVYIYEVYDSRQNWK